MATSSDAIVFNHVHFTVNNTTILKNISGGFPSGKVTCLLGPSGSGKTTLLKLCNGLISPSSGEIFIQNKEINSYEPVELRRKVGIALQHAPMMRGTVFDNLSLPLRLQGKELSVEQAKEILHDVGLRESFLQHNANELSGGQKQRVSIARTLLNHSSILLLDEITSGLDKEAETEIENLILHINQKYEVTIIWITHDLQQAFKVGEYMWMLADGQVVETGDIQLLKSTTNKQLLQFIEGGTS